MELFVPRRSKGIRDLTVCLGLLCLLLVGPKLQAQTTTDRPTTAQTALVNVFKDLEKKFKVSFSYDSQLLEGIEVATKLPEGNLERQMKFLLDDTELSFEIIEGYVIVKPGLAQREKVKLCGFILDQQSQQPLSFANVFVRGTDLGTQTAQNGYFELMAYPSRKKIVEFSYLGYQSKAIELNLLQVQPCRDIGLSRMTSTLGEVVVEEEATENSGHEILADQMIFRPSLQQILPGTPDADILQGLQLIPGVTGSDETANGIHIRGGTPDQNLLLWDDIPVYQSGHFFGMISSFNPDLIGQVALYKSGYSAKYGGGISSVIDIQTKNEIPDQAKVKIGANLLYANLYAEVPLFKKKAMLLFGARRSFTDFFSSNTYDRFIQQFFQNGRVKEDPERINNRVPLVPSMTFQDLNLKFLAKVSDRDVINFSMLLALDRLEYTQFLWWSDEQLTYDEVIDQSMGWNVSWRRQWSTKFVSKWSASRSTFSSDYAFTDDLGNDYFQVFQRFENGLQESTVKLINNWQPQEEHQFEWGYQWSHRRSELLYEEDWYGVDSLFDQAASGLTQSVFGDYLFSVTQQFDFQIGLRYNYYHPLQQHFFEPRFRVSAQPISDLTLKASAGQYIQYLNQLVTDDNDLEDIEQQWVVAGKAEGALVAPPVRSTQLAFGLLWQKNNWAFEVEAYTKKVSELTSQKVFFDRFYNPNVTGDAEIRGMDVLIKKDWSNFQMMLGYTFNETTYYFQFINGDRAFAPSYFQRHRLLLANTLKWGNCLLTAKWIWANGVPFTNANGIAFNDIGLPYVELGFYNAEQLPSYHRLDASASYQFKWGKQKALESKIGVSLLNIYNRNNFLRRSFGVNFEEDMPQTAQIETRNKLGLPFIPNLLLEVQF
ncbi:MAG: TonB-dependent receptor [Bacteroidota bacterium]